MNAKLLSFPASRLKPSAGEPKLEAGPSMTTIQLVLPVAMADKLKIAAGYACKSPAQWATDGLSALLDMDLAG